MSLLHMAIAYKLTVTSSGDHSTDKFGANRKSEINAEHLLVVRTGTGLRKEHGVHLKPRLIELSKENWYRQESSRCEQLTINRDKNLNSS